MGIIIPDMFRMGITANNPAPYPKHIHRLKGLKIGVWNL